MFALFMSTSYRAQTMTHPINRTDSFQTRLFQHLPSFLRLSKNRRRLESFFRTKTKSEKNPSNLYPEPVDYWMLLIGNLIRDQDFPDVYPTSSEPVDHNKSNHCSLTRITNRSFTRETGYACLDERIIHRKGSSSQQIIQVRYLHRTAFSQFGHRPQAAASRSCVLAGRLL